VAISGLAIVPFALELLCRDPNTMPSTTTLPLASSSVIEPALVDRGFPNH
jgi:hypothetical protein